MLSSYYYIVLHDIDSKSLKGTLSLIINSLNNNGLESKQLTDKELAKFIKYSYTNDFNERDFNKLQPKDYLSASVPNSVAFKSSRVIQDDKWLTHFVITKYTYWTAKRQL